MTGFAELFKPNGCGFQLVVDLFGAERGLARVRESPFVRTQLVEQQG